MNNSKAEIIIEEVGTRKKKFVQTSAKLPRLDKQDILLVIGLVSLLRGVWLVYPPAALILGGLLALGQAWVIEWAQIKSVIVAERNNGADQS